MLHTGYFRVEFDDKGDVLNLCDYGLDEPGVKVVCCEWYDNSDKQEHGYIHFPDYVLKVDNMALSILVVLADKSAKSMLQILLADDTPCI